MQNARKQQAGLSTYMGAGKGRETMMNLSRVVHLSASTVQDVSRVAVIAVVVLKKTTDGMDHVNDEAVRNMCIFCLLRGAHVKVRIP